MKQIDFLELSQSEFDVAAVKNEYIAKNSGEFIAFINQNVTNKKEVLEVLETYNLLEGNAGVVFGAGVPQNIDSVADILACFDMQIFAFILPRVCLVETGNFNTKILQDGNIEFLCRIWQNCGLCVIPCETESGYESMRDSATYAYMLRRYMVDLQNEGRLNELFSQVVSYFDGFSLKDEFEKAMERMLAKNGRFEEIERETSPFFILSGNDMCHGVLKGFATSLADSLVSMGQAVITTDGTYGKFENYEILANGIFKGIVGFQAPALEKEYFRKINCKKFQFWFDNPIFFDDLLHNLPEDYYILCQDGLYAKFIREHYNTSNAIQVPPAGVDLGMWSNLQRNLDVTFIGTYNKAQTAFEGMKQQFFDYMIQNPKFTYEGGLLAFLKEYNWNYREEEFVQIINDMADVCRGVNNYYRTKVMETLLNAGIQIHVYGDSWQKYDGKGKENLILHPAVSVEESLDILAHSKVGLNVMTWHKAGMTERIANIMLSGAVCVSDETEYLRKHFVENEEIVLFELDKLEELPEKIKWLLEDEEARRKIAENAYKNASTNHTWKQRAEALLKLLT